MVADMGFRPNPNGFAFENYGNDAGAQNLTSSEMQRLFGPSVCANHAKKPTPEPAPAPVTPIPNNPGNGGGSNGGGSNNSGGGSNGGQPTDSGGDSAFDAAADPGSCNLTPDAQAWMDDQNKGMDGGHCNGFAVLAEELYKKQSPFDPFGPGATYSYGLPGNSGLQRAIAYAFVYQFLPAVTSKRLHADANTILSKLQTALSPSNTETYTLGIYKPDGSGGHAITPYAIEDLGGGMKAIDVYDNNYPNEARQVLVNTTANTWSYSGASNPALKQDLYGPSATDSNLEIDPTTPGQGIQPGQFGKSGGSLGAAPDAGATAASKLDTVMLDGNLHYHAHVIVNDGPGHQVGVINGKIVNTFPGAIVRPILQFNDYTESKDPAYLIPSRNVKLTIDGSSLKSHSDTESLSDLGDGQALEVRNVRINPGQKDVLSLMNGASNLAFSLAKGKGAGSPTLRIGADSSKADIALTLQMVSAHPGATIHVQLNAAKQRITFYSTGNHGLQKFVLRAVKETKTATYVEGSDTITLRGTQSISYSYAK
jgi:hypothetical protein